VKVMKLADLRIQLEGRVEKLERALWAWERAARSMRSNGWRSGTLFALLAEVTPEIDEAIAKVQQKAAESAELGAMLERLEQAKEQVRVEAARNLSGLGVRLPSEGLEAVLAELRLHHPILHHERLGWSRPHMVAVLSGAALFLVMLAIAGLMWPWLLVAVVVGLTVGTRWWKSTPVLLTQRTLVVGKHAGQLAEILEISGDTNRLKCRFTVVLRDQPAWKVTSAGTPEELFRKLRLQGVRCELLVEPIARRAL
jgi:hypothetical protein